MAEKETIKIKGRAEKQSPEITPDFPEKTDLDDAQNLAQRVSPFLYGLLEAAPFGQPNSD